MHLAARNGEDDRIKELLSMGDDPNARDNNLFAPLHWAALEGRPGAARLLLSGGADLDARERSGSTPLMLAARVGDDEMVDLLVAAGASLEAQDLGGRTAEDWARIGWRKETELKLRQAKQIRGCEKERELLDEAALGAELPGKKPKL